MLTAAFALMGTAAAVTTLEVDGKDFVNSKTKERFQIIGVEYVPEFDSQPRIKNVN